MGRYFGTDGIRGVVPRELSVEICFSLGNSLTEIMEKPKVIIGGDTRLSTGYILDLISAGIKVGGGSCSNLGVASTPKISYLTKTGGYDFGVVVSASHNDAMYNGIKVFDKNGEKILDSKKEIIEDFIFESKRNLVDYSMVGRDIKPENQESYENFLENSCINLSGLKVAIDCSNGANYSIAKRIFKRKNADVTALSVRPNGVNINRNCGSTHILKLENFVKKHKGYVGFSYDGDGDRLIAVDENGSVVDGDKILYLLACYYKERGMLKNNLVIGTKQSNMGLVVALKKKGIDFLRSDVGDSFVVEMMKNHKSILGGESSGHVILGDKMFTGDGLLTSLEVASIMKKTGQSLSDLTKIHMYPLESINILVKSKTQVIRQESLSLEIEKVEDILGTEGRVVVRPSGTEEKIRVLVEGVDEKIVRKLAVELQQKILEIDESM